MAKENYIKFRCSDDFKYLVEQQAKERGMTVSSYIKHLIRKDVDVMRVVYNDFITDEMEEVFKDGSTDYLSSDGSAWLFTDMEVFKKMDKKFQFGLETEERDYVYNTNIESYISNRYSDAVADYFGFDIALSEYDETDVCEDNIECLCNNEWDKKIEAWIKADVVLEIKERMREVIRDMLHDGYDITELKGIVDDILYAEKILNDNE